MVLIALVLHQMFPAPRQKDSIPDRVYMEEREVINAKPLQGPGITEDFLTVNEYSRPGEALETVNNIFRTFIRRIPGQAPHRTAAILKISVLRERPLRVRTS